MERTQAYYIKKLLNSFFPFCPLPTHEYAAALQRYRQCHAGLAKHKGLEKICMSLRSSRSSSLDSSGTFLPSNKTSPEVGSMRRRITRPVVVLPHPLSPTRPSVSPRLTVKLMPSTALTAPTCLEKMMPFVIGKCLRGSLLPIAACWTQQFQPMSTAPPSALQELRPDSPPASSKLRSAPHHQP